MDKRHFLVSIKTVDDTPLFPANFKGDDFLFKSIGKITLETNVMFEGYGSFPTGLELVLYCNDVKQARKYADKIAHEIYKKTNNLGHVINSFGIHISELTNDERTLEAVAMDMMARSLASRGLDLASIPTLSLDKDGNLLN